MFQDILYADLKIPTNTSESCNDILRKLLEKNPDKRLGSLKGAEEIKAHEFFNGIDWDIVERKELILPIPDPPDLTKEISKDAILDLISDVQPTIQGWTFVSDSDS